MSVKALIPTGFALHEGFAAAHALADFVDGISWQQPTIHMFGREITVPRLTAWFGDGAYTYSGIRHEPARLPSIVADLRHRVETLTGARFNSVLANYYRDGSDSVSWHADDEPELGAEPVIASLSFGATRNFAVRKLSTATRHDILLAHGDLLVMSGRSQVDYHHAILKTTRPLGPRVNFTFRRVAI